MKIIQSDTPSPFVAVCYGPPGSGKSRAIGTWPSKALILQTEPGRISAFEIPGADKHISVVKAESWDDVTDIRRGLGAWLTRHKIVDDFDLIAVDSLTVLADLCKASVVREYPPKSVASIREGIPELQQWMMIVERMRQVMTALINSGKACWLICQAVVKEMGPESNPQSLWLPRLPGELRTALPYMVDLFFWAQVSVGKYEVVTQGSALAMGKTRGIADVPRVLPLDLAKINELWTKSFK